MDMDKVFRDVANQVYQHLKTYGKAIEEAYLKSEGKKGIKVGFSASLKPNPRVVGDILPKTSISFVPERIKDTLEGSVMKHLQIPLGITDDAKGEAVKQ